MLKIANRTWTTDPTEISSLFLDHFTNIFNSTNPEPPQDLKNLFLQKITNHENEILCKIPVEEEILDTIKQTPSTKAPGPDGFKGLFYKT